MFHRGVILEAYLPEEIKPQEGEYDYPYGQIDLPVQETPVVSLVRNAQELESQGDLDEAQHYLDTVQPGSALEFLQEGREESQYREWKGKGNAEGQHGDHRSPEFP